MNFYLNTTDTNAVDLAEQYLMTPASVQAEKEAGELFQQWKLRSLADAYAPRPPLKFLVDGLLPCPSLSIVYGSPGSLKSMLLADMAICIAAGLRWLEPLGSDRIQPGRTLATVQAPSLWIDFDNGTRRTDERMDAMARSRGLPIDTPIRYVSMPTPWLDASKRSMVMQLAGLIKIGGYKLVIIDNLGLITGDVEENSAGMAQVMGNLRWLCEECDCALIVVHHQRKSNGSADANVRKGEMLRGHSSIEAAIDLGLIVERKNNEDAVAIIPTKVRGYKIIDILGAHFAYSHREGTYDLEEARFFSVATENEQDREKRAIIEAAQREIRERKSAVKQGELVNAVRDYLAATAGKTPGVNKIRGVLKEAVQDGQFREFADDKGPANRAQFYDLAINRRVILADSDEDSN